MALYAQNTSVSVERSRAEIESILRRYGAEKFMSGWDDQSAYLAFIYAQRAVRLTISLPNKKEFSSTPTGRHRSSSSAVEQAWAQACRQRWRALALVIKAKLESVSAGIASFEDEFLAYTLLPDGQTVSQWLEPQLYQALSDGAMPQLALPEPSK